MIITLNDGTFLYSAETVAEYLSTLGFNVDELIEMFMEDYVPEGYVDKNDVDNWERIADGYYNNGINMSEEILEIADRLASGKGGTKVQYAERLRSCVENYGFV